MKKLKHGRDIAHRNHAQGKVFRAAAILFGIALGAAVPAASTSIGRERVTTETAHFLITVDRFKLDAAMDAAEWLEDAWRTQAAFYTFEPAGKIQVALLDEDDFSNGYAYAANSWIVLHLPPARFMLRGDARWMPNVAAHELAHIFTLRKMGLTSRFLGVEAFASWGSRRSRADAAVAWIPDDVPAWLAEGLAQYGAMRGGRDTLDARRRMLLRTAWESGALPSLKAMEAFSGDARDGEMNYNAGFHFVDYLYRVHGRDAVNAMMEAWDDHGYHGAFRRAFGADPETLDARWRATLDARFATEGVAPAAAAPSPATYVVETSPVLDSARGILYVLSSRANDFGITNLYARDARDARDPDATGRGRLLMHDVSPPLNPAPDGGLLFAATRVDPRTGARRSDLYRYDAETGGVTRVTRNLRAVAGAQAGDRVYALLQDAGRTRLARLAKDGAPDAWIHPPAGTEFMSLSPGDDTTLYVAATRGLRADIFRIDVRTGTLTPAEASPASEIDPRVSGGRLYFSSDRSGEPAVYSRAEDVLLRHTPPGTPAFTPFVSRNTLYYAAYESGGFRVRAVPLAIDSVLVAPADTLPTEHESPSPVRIRNLRADRTRMEPLGYYATLGYARSSHADVYGTLYDEERSFRLNPCGHRAFAGGGLLASDPASRHQLAGTFLAGRCLESSATGPGKTSLPFAAIEYVNDDMTPLFLIQAAYQSEPLSNPESDRHRIGGIHQFQVATAARYDLAYAASFTPFALIGGTVIDLPGADGERSVTGGGGLAAGGTLGLALLEPGADFVNEGAYADLTVAAAPGTLLFSAAGGLYGNVRRTLFIGVGGDAFRAGSDDESFDAGMNASLDLRLPLNASPGGAGYRGIRFESLFLQAGYAARAESFSGVTLTYGQRLPALTTRSPRRGAAPIAQIREISSQTMILGFRLKVVTPGSRVAFWKLQWEAPADDARAGGFGLAFEL